MKYRTGSTFFYSLLFLLATAITACSDKSKSEILKLGNWDVSLNGHYDYTLDCIDNTEIISIASKSKKNKEEVINISRTIDIPRDTNSQQLNIDYIYSGKKDADAFIGCDFIDSDGVFIYQTKTIQKLQLTNAWKKGRLIIDQVPKDAEKLIITVGLIGNGQCRFKEINFSPAPHTIVEVLAKTVDTTLTSLIKQHAMNLEKTVPNENFLQTFKNKKIIGIGESTHGTSEYYRSRRELITFFAQRLGFNTICFELDAPSGELINKYINEGIGQPKAILSTLPRIFQTKEMLETIHWMRTYNQRHAEKLKVFGVDIKGIEGLVANIENITELIDDKGNIELKLTEIKDVYSKITKRYGENKKMDNELSQLFRQLSAEGTSLKSCIERNIKMSKIPDNRLTIALRYAEIIQQYGNVYGISNDPNRMIDLHDQYMFENINFVRDFAKGNSKILFIAHNNHITKNKRGLSGNRLKEKYGSNYAAIGLFTGTGSYAQLKNGKFEYINLTTPPINSYEHYFNQSKYSSFLLTTGISHNSNGTHYLHELRNVGSEETDRLFNFENIYTGYDAIVFLKNTQATHPY